MIYKQLITYLAIFTFLISGGQTLRAQEEKPQQKKGEVGFFGAYGQSDLYRTDDDRFNPIGPNHQKAWKAGISLRGGWKIFEARVDAYFASQGGRELFDTNTSGVVESDVRLSYLGVSAQPINLRFQMKKFFFHFGGGGYAAVLMNSKILVNDREFVLKQTESLTPYDYGLILSSGVGFGRINVVGSFQAGYSPIEPTSNSANNHLVTLGLTLWI